MVFLFCFTAEKEKSWNYFLMATDREDEKLLEKIVLDIDSLESRVMNLITEANSLADTQIFSSSGDPRYNPSPHSPRCPPVSNVGRVSFKKLNTNYNNISQ